MTLELSPGHGGSVANKFVGAVSRPLHRACWVRDLTQARGTTSTCSLGCRAHPTKRLIPFEVCHLRPGVPALGRLAGSELSGTEPVILCWGEQPDRRPESAGSMRSTGHFALQLRPLDSATEPRTVAARLTIEDVSAVAAPATPCSPWSPPTVQMCHLSDSKGCLLIGTRRNGPRRPGGVDANRKPATEPQGLQPTAQRVVQTLIEKGST